MADGLPPVWTGDPTSPSVPDELITNAEIVDDPMFAAYAYSPSGCTAIHTGVVPVEMFAGEVALSAPVPVLILNSETWFDISSATYKNCPLGFAAIEIGPNPAE